MVADLYIKPKNEVITGSLFNNDLLPESEPGHVVKEKKNVNSC